MKDSSVFDKARELFPGNPSARLGFTWGVRYAAEIFLGLWLNMKIQPKDGKD